VDICPKCGLPIQACVCEEISRTQQKINVSTEKRRFGKYSTLISGIEDNNEIKTVAKTLKAKRACGGTIKNKIIELQGNHKKMIKPILVEMGYNPELIED
jgi:translation initiation factor 1